ncbi:hypothetical protein ACUN0C_10915 [Faunimonas sp. B44]|uniref:hypothetical protein n=1 Tax=Faunimonas sp. B44 TaxID=3461493 RepID=UPI0040445A81
MGEASRYAVVEDGVVTNVVLWDSETPWAPEAGEAIACPIDVGIGWACDGEGFRPPPDRPAAVP